MSSSSIFRRPLQIGTFMRKEMTDALHQPRLLLTLVFGPFLIMAAFGLGYDDTPPKLRTMLVAPAGSAMLERIGQYGEQLSSYVDVVGTTSDIAAADRSLRDDDIDVIVSFPGDPLGTVLNGERAPITIVHTQLDPIQRSVISFASSLAVDRINGAVIAQVIAQGTESAAPAAAVLDSADAATAALAEAVGNDDTGAANAAMAQLDSLATQLTVAVETSGALVDQVTTDPATKEHAKALATSADELSSTIEQLQQEQAAGGPSAVSVQHASEVLGSMRADYQQFIAVDPAVLARPFAPDVQLAVPGVHRVTDWYAPAAVVLMLQQFGIAFGALSFVRERQLGIDDVFRVAPVNAGSALVGKYVAYLLIGGLIGALLTALVAEVLDVPMGGNIADVAIAMGLSLFASIGLGFVISLVSGSDAQAVQYTLIVLLASLFFSGFFLAVGQMTGPAKIITWLLPVSYGMKMLRDVMLRGSSPDTELLLQLGAYGVAMFLLALFGASRRMSSGS